MNNVNTSLLFLLFGWLLLDFLGLLTLIEPVRDQISRKNRLNLKSFMQRKYILLLITLELIGLILLISSFSLRWYYHRYTGMYVVNHLRYFYLKDAINLDSLLTFFISYAYLIGLILIFIKITMKKKIHIFTGLELIELTFFVIGLILMLNLRFMECNQIAVFPGGECIESGHSTGFTLYIIGLLVLIINGLQMSIYRWLKRNKNQIMHE